MTWLLNKNEPIAETGTNWVEDNPGKKNDMIRNFLKSTNVGVGP